MIKQADQAKVPNDHNKPAGQQAERASKPDRWHHGQAKLTIVSRLKYCDRFELIEAFYHPGSLEVT